MSNFTLFHYFLSNIISILVLFYERKITKIREKTHFFHCNQGEIRSNITYPVKIKTYEHIIHLSPWNKSKNIRGMSCLQTHPNTPVMSSLLFLFLDRTTLPAWKLEHSYPKKKRKENCFWLKQTCFLRLATFLKHIYINGHLRLVMIVQ